MPKEREARRDQLYYTEAHYATPYAMLPQLSRLGLGLAALRYARVRGGWYVTTERVSPNPPVLAKPQAVA